MKSKRMILLSIFLAVSAGLAVFRYLSELERKTSLEANLGVALVAKSDIPARTRLEETMFALIRLPKDFIHPEALTEPVQIRGAFARERLAAGEQVLASRLAPAGQVGAGMAYLISPGYRAFSLAVDSVSGVGGFILPEDRVDVFVTIDVAEGEIRTVTTALVAENLRVLAVGTVTHTAEQEHLAAENVTLEVPANRVAALAHAGNRGTLRLTLRSVGDKGIIQVRHHLTGEFLP